jgi:hypothetical protein
LLPSFLVSAVSAATCGVARVFSESVIGDSSMGEYGSPQTYTEPKKPEEGSTISAPRHQLACRKRRIILEE